MKSEITTLKAQVNLLFAKKILLNMYMAHLLLQVMCYKKFNTFYNENPENFENWTEEIMQKSNSLSQLKFKNFAPERLESCLKELKEVREVNLLLRKNEGEYQAKIVRLEDEMWVDFNFMIMYFYNFK